MMVDDEERRDDGEERMTAADAMRGTEESDWMTQEEERKIEGGKEDFNRRGVLFL